MNQIFDLRTFGVLKDIFSTPEAKLALLGGVVLILLIIAFFVARSIFRRRVENRTAFNKKVLLVTVPKNEEKEEERKPLEDLLQPAEKLFDNLGGRQAQSGLKNWFLERQDHFSLEIVSGKEGVISFYFAVPEEDKRFFEQQIHAQYPHARITEVEDYNVFTTDSETAGAVLKLKKNSALPIKTYNDFKKDPLNAIVNSLSKIAPEDAAVIQFVVRPARRGWQKKGAKAAKKIQEEGVSVRKALSSSKIFKAIHEWQTGGSKKNDDMKPSSLSPMEQEVVKSLEQKSSKTGLEINVRIIVSADTQRKADDYLDDIADSFAQYTGHEYLNGFRLQKKKNASSLMRDFIYRSFNESQKFVLNSEELVSLFHIPLPDLETPNVQWAVSKTLPLPADAPTEGTVIAKNIFRGEEKEVRIKKADRRRHFYVIGKTGTGKTYLLTRMIIQDIKNGEGGCFIDPHGDAIDTILKHIPEERKDDVIYFNPADNENAMGLNLLEYDPKHPEQKTFAVNEMINIMDKLYDLDKTGGPMFEQYMRNAMLLIMEDPESGSTLMEIPRVLADTDFRHYKLDRCQNSVVKDFWVTQAEKAGGEASLSNITPYITSKLNQFVSNDIMRPIIGQQKSAFDFREVMDNQKILLINLSKGRLGEKNAHLLGLIIVGKILMASLSRTDMPEEKRKDFYLYMDEFQNFITESISTILAEARKYHLCLNMAHQYIDQLVRNQDESIKDAVFGTVGTIGAFKVGREDAEFLSKEFGDPVTPYDLMNIEKYNAYFKLLVDNQSTRPFNVQTIVLPDGDPQRAEEIKKLSAKKYGVPREEAEAVIEKRMKLARNDN